MWTKIIIGVAVVVLLVGGAALFFASRLDGIVADAIERYGGAATGTEVDVGGVDIAVTEGRGELTRLTIGNPNGFETDYALRIDDIRLALDLGSLTGDVPVVSEVILDGAHVNAEQRGEATNLTDIQRYIEGTPSESAGGEQGRIIIDRFRLTNARVTITSELLEEPEELALRDVTVNGVGRTSGGATYGEAAEAVLTPIFAAARTAVQDRLRDEAADEAREEVEEEARERLEELLDRER
jgi:hypothetical protein